MSNDLVITGDLSYEQLAALTGQDTGGSGGNSLPRVGTNKHAEDNDGNQLPIRTVTVELPGVGKVYGKQVKFRPFVQRYQYQHYDGEAPNDKGGKGKMIGVTKLIADFNEEPLDTNGGKRLGKPDGKAMKQLTDEQKKKYKDIKCYRLLYGTISIADAVDAKGNKHEVENLPCIWRFSGTGFMGPDKDGIDPTLKALSKQKKNMFNYFFVPELERKVNGDTVYYAIHWKVDTTQHVQLTPDDIELLKNFVETINAENEQIMKQHNAALRGEVQNDEAEDFMSKFEGHDDLGDDV